MINYSSLLKLSIVKRFNKDAVMLSEGAHQGGEMLVLLHGSAGVYQNYQTPDEKLLSTLEPGSVMGEYALFLDKPYTQTVVALSEVIAVAVNRQNAPELFTTQPELTFSIFESICKKMDGLMQTHQKLITDVRAGVATKNLLESERRASRRSALFPPEHGSYALPIDNSMDEYIYENKLTCPLCGQKFSSLNIISSKLRRENAAIDDLRVRYKDIEPMYYDIASCPGCLYSAPAELFEGVSRKFAARINEEVSSLKSEIVIKTGYERDSFTVFAGYYLAIICAPVCFDEYQMITANLWMKLSRIYSDMQDETMYLYACGRSLKEYMYSYEHFGFSQKKMQQMCVIIGDLYQRLGDLEQARTFFYYAKTNRDGSSVLKRQADIRLDEIKQIIKQQKEDHLAGSEQ